MKIGLFTQAVSQIPFDRLLDLSRESGIEAIELGVSGRSSTPGFEAEMLLANEERRSQIAEAVHKHGMVISAFNATANPLHPRPEVREKYIDAIKSAIRLAEAMSVSRVVTGAGIPGESAESKYPAWIAFGESSRDVLEWQWKEVATPIWRDLAAYATEHGVRICIEVLPGTLAFNTDSFLRLRSIGGDAIGMNFDPSHLIWQGMDPAVVALALEGCIYHAHAKDTFIDEREVRRNGVLEIRSDWKNRAWTFCTMGDGHDAVFWRGVLRALRRAGYDDVWSIEHEDPTVEPEAAIKRNARFVQQVLE